MNASICSLNKISSRWFVMLCIAMSLGAWVRADDADNAVTVDVAKAKTTQRVFDPSNPPADRPQMSPSEDALTVSQFGFTAQMTGAIVDHTGDSSGQTVVTVRIDHVDVKAKLNITIWIPTRCTAKLKAHENGHRKISEIYFQGADAIARSLASQLIGQTVQGRGDNLQAAAHAAIQHAIADLTRQYMQPTLEASQKVQQLYDNITDHGKNNVPEDDAIQQAIADAKQGE